MRNFARRADQNHYCGQSIWGGMLLDEITAWRDLIATSIVLSRPIVVGLKGETLLSKFQIYGCFVYTNAEWS
jgi:hypothetical protein